MPYVPLALPPGIYRNGTKYQSLGRWYEGNLVRWSQGALGPVGGWERKQVTNPSVADINVTDPIRGMIAWRANDQTPWMAYGTKSKVYVFSEGVQTEITPVGFTAGAVDAAMVAGTYGNSLYGQLNYGEGDLAQETLVEANTWQLDTFGQYLVGCAYSDGKLYVWDLNTGNDFAAMTNAPTGQVGIVVTPEHMVVGLAGRTVSWSDQDDYTVWTPDVDNQAGSFELPGGGQLLSGRRGRNETLLWTDLDMFAMRYIGGTLVYSFHQVGSQCGLIARNAVAMVDNRAVWMGKRGFFVYDGFVRVVPCDVESYIFDNLNKTQASKICAVSLAERNEVWFFYPSAGSDENDRYVILNYVENHYSIGELERTSGVDRGVFQFPMMTDAGGHVYDHERGGNYVDVDDSTELAPYAESGPVEIGSGDQTFLVSEYIPDDKTIGTVTGTLYVSLYPGETEGEQTFTASRPTSLRMTGRWARVRIQQAAGSVDTTWRIGKPRLNITPGGLR